MQSTPSPVFSRRLLDRTKLYRNLLLVACITLAFAFYMSNLGRNPPGFYLDESSIAYNAYLIAQSGADEHGVRFPLYFRAFGEYKNPAYIYLLAVVFKIFGASILLARLTSAVLGFVAALLLARLAWQVSERFLVAIFVGAAAMFGPWLFEIGRLVFEVALFPFALALFLLWLYRAHSKNDWSMLSNLRLVLALGLITYTYSIGRLFAPLLAFGLILFITRRTVTPILRTWAFYGLTLLPLLVFNFRYPGALTARFHDLSYIKPQSALAETVFNFITHYVNNWSLRSMLLVGDLNARHHVPGTGSILLAVFILFVIGLIVVLRYFRRDAWWRYVVYGLLVSVVPASLTLDQFHTLRLTAFPVFMLLLNVPALMQLMKGGSRSFGRKILIALCALAFLQIAFFQWNFHRLGSQRYIEFEAQYVEIFDAAVAAGQRPIYLYDKWPLFGYIHAYWYATLRGMNTTEFVHLPPDGTVKPPPGALVISTLEPCAGCRIIRRRQDYTAYFEPER